MTNPVRESRAYLNFLRAAAVLLILIGSSGCAGKKEPTQQGFEQAYFDELKRWTREKKIYEGVDAKVYINATYKHPSFRNAYIDKYAKSYQLEEPYVSSLIEREKEQADRYNEFFMAAYTPDDNWNDFDRRNSIWRLYLEDNFGARLIPVSITRIDKSDPVYREFFPYFDPWSAGYIVRFPKFTDTGTEPVPSENTEFLRLTVTGILGKGELEWRLK